MNAREKLTDRGFDLDSESASAALGLMLLNAAFDAAHAAKGMPDSGEVKESLGRVLAALAEPADA